MAGAASVYELVMIMRSVAVMVVAGLMMIGTTVLAADPDPLSDFASGVSTSFTLRDIFTNGDVSVGPGGTRTTVNVGIFPAMG